MIKKLLLATIGGVMFSTPALAQSEYMEGYQEGMKVGLFMAYCNAYMEGDYKDQGLARHMTFAYYNEMDAGNRQWARETKSECVPL